MKQKYLVLKAETKKAKEREMEAVDSGGATASGPDASLKAEATKLRASLTQRDQQLSSCKQDLEAAQFQNQQVGSTILHCRCVCSLSLCSSPPLSPSFSPSLVPLFIHRLFVSVWRCSSSEGLRSCKKNSSASPQRRRAKNPRVPRSEQSSTQAWFITDFLNQLQVFEILNPRLLISRRNQNVEDF